MSYMPCLYQPSRLPVSNWMLLILKALQCDDTLAMDKLAGAGAFGLEKLWKPFE